MSFTSPTACKPKLTYQTAQPQAHTCMHTIVSAGILPGYWQAGTLYQHAVARPKGIYLKKHGGTISDGHDDFLIFVVNV